MQLQWKVCGMRDPHNITEIGRLQPDWMGFIFYPSSRRYVGDHFAIPDTLPVGVKRVGVFVNQSVDDITRLARRHALNAVQLHGSEPVSDCGALKAEGMLVIKAFGVEGSIDFDAVKAYTSSVDYFLFDTHAATFGGTGRTFDWSLLESYHLSVPYFLAGGMDAVQVQRLERKKLPGLTAVDINSAVEDQPGLKNIDRVRAVIKSLEKMN